MATKKLQIDGGGNFQSLAQKLKKKVEALIKANPGVYKLSPGSFLNAPQEDNEDFALRHPEWTGMPQQFTTPPTFQQTGEGQQRMGFTALDAALAAQTARGRAGFPPRGANYWPDIAPSPAPTYAPRPETEESRYPERAAREQSWRQEIDEWVDYFVTETEAGRPPQVIYSSVIPSLAAAYGSTVDDFIAELQDAGYIYDSGTRRWVRGGYARIYSPTGGGGGGGGGGWEETAYDYGGGGGGGWEETAYDYGGGGGGGAYTPSYSVANDVGTQFLNWRLSLG